MGQSGDDRSPRDDVPGLTRRRREELKGSVHLAAFGVEVEEVVE